MPASRRPQRRPRSPLRAESGAGEAAAAAGLPAVCTGGERACSSGELRLSPSHSIFLLLVKPLGVATSITSHDSCFTPLPTWSLTLLVKTVNRFDFLKQIILCVTPPGCLYSFHSFQCVNIGYYFSGRKKFYISISSSVQIVTLSHSKCLFERQIFFSFISFYFKKFIMHRKKGLYKINSLSTVIYLKQLTKTLVAF